VRLLHLPHRDGDTRHQALTARMADLPATLLRSITWDQGTEMARHLTITESLGAPVYFCDARSPWQRGSNENMNGLLRDYFPKGTDLNAHSPEHLLAVENELNSRPRLVLNDPAPAELLQALLTSGKRPCCDVDRQEPHESKVHVRDLWSRGWDALGDPTFGVHSSFTEDAEAHISAVL